VRPMARTDGERRAQDLGRGESGGGGGFNLGWEYVFAVIMSWALPGAGHWLLGFRVRGMVLGVLLLGTFWWGEAVAGGYAVHQKEHPVFFYGQVGIGASAFVAVRMEPRANVRPRPDDFPAFGAKPIDRRIPPGLPIGILLTSVAGLLNVLLVIYVMDPRTWETPPPGRIPPGGR